MLSPGLGNYTVPYPEETSADRGGGPIRREGRSLVITDYSMALNPTPILRTPHGVGNDAEPGGKWLPELLKKKMLPDGRLVDQDSLRGAFGAPGTLDLVDYYGAATLSGALLGFVYSVVWGRPSEKDLGHGDLLLTTMMGGAGGVMLAMLLRAATKLEK